MFEQSMTEIVPLDFGLNELFVNIESYTEMKGRLIWFSDTRFESKIDSVMTLFSLLESMEIANLRGCHLRHVKILYLWVIR